MFSKVGRSFYICKNCINTDDKKINKALSKVSKNNKSCVIDKKFLKEIMANG